MINWAEKDADRYLYLLAIVDILAILALVYVYFFNTYRIDYVSGELLVDPQKSKYVTIIAYAYALGLVNGSFLCRRFFPFNPKEVSVKRRIIRGIVGSAGLVLMLKYALENVFLNVVDLKIGFPVVFFIGIVVTLVYPVIFSKFKRI